MRNSLASSKCCDAPFDMVDDEEQSSTLYLGNLPKDPRICRRLLYEIGVQAGPVVSINLPADPARGRPTYAFIEYESVESAAYAVQLLRGNLRLLDRPVLVDFGGKKGGTRDAPAGRAEQQQTPGPAGRDGQQQWQYSPAGMPSHQQQTPGPAGRDGQQQRQYSPAGIPSHQQQTHSMAPYDSQMQQPEQQSMHVQQQQQQPQLQQQQSMHVQPASRPAW